MQHAIPVMVGTLPLFLRGGGEAARLIARLGPGRCPLGAPRDFPPHLRSVLSLVLTARAQVVVLWGPDHVAFYNDAYAPTIGDKHPAALGRPAREVWAELWDVLGPLLDRVRETGETFESRDHPFLIERRGFLEQVYFDVSYSAVRGAEGRVEGLLCLVSETTGRVLSERRLRGLRAAGLRLAGATTARGACGALVESFASEDPEDLPWARVLLREAGGLVEAVAHGPAPPAPGEAALRPVLEEGEARELSLAGPEGEARPALVLPLVEGDRVAGVLLAGLDPHLVLAGEYATALGLAAGQASLALTRLRRAEAEARSAERLRESEARFRAMADEAPVMVWVTDAEGRCTYLSRSWFEFTGQSPERALGRGWAAAIHPEDRAGAEAAFRDAAEAGRGFRMEYRLRSAAGGHAWALVAAAARHDGAGRFAGFVGSVLDITERRRAEEARDTLARELSHRIKNIFMVTGGLARLTARGDPAAEAFAARLQERLRALSLAHDFTRPDPASIPGEEPPSVHGLVRVVLAPYAEAGRERVLVSGEDRPLGYAAANALALLLHELATNAVKYGALSAAGGRVSVETAIRGEELLLSWREEGGPPVEGPPARRGFGTTMAVRSVSGQLRGRMESEWRREGLVVRLAVPLESLGR